MTDTIRAALEKAAMAPNPCGAAAGDKPSATEVARAAATITTFLRQIDSITLAQIVANAAEAHRAAKPTIGAALAAAVEEAAKGAGE